MLIVSLEISVIQKFFTNRIQPMDVLSGMSGLAMAMARGLLLVQGSTRELSVPPGAPGADLQGLMYHIQLIATPRNTQFVL